MVLFSLIIRLIRLVSRTILFIFNPVFNLFSRFYSAVERNYLPLLKWSLKNKGTVIAISIALLAVSIAIIPFLGVELIPQLSQGEYKVEFRLPPGTPLERTDEIIAAAQKDTAKLKNIATLFSVTGTGNRMDANPDQGGENWGEMNVALTKNSTLEDEKTSMEEIRKGLEQVSGLQYKFSRPTLFSFKTPVEIEIFGFSLDKLRQVSVEIAKKMEASKRFADVKSTMEIGYPEIQVRFNREKAAQLGIPVYRIAERIVNEVRGNVATRYSWHDRKIDVLVRAREEDRASIEHIRQLIVNPESDRPTTLASVADITVDNGPGEIRRIGQERVALVTANLDYGDLGSAALEIDQIISGIQIPTDMTARLAGQNEEMTVSFQSLRFALLLGVFLVYLVMACQFESFIHPLVIMFTLPLALIGAAFALWITNTTINVVVLLGGILLVGIVVNNAIVLIDRVNQVRSAGMKKEEAILEAGPTRLRPIAMTTLTTVLGLLPMALGIGEGAEIRAPMAITVIGGLSVSTLLTLIVIPVVYSLMDRKK